MIRFSESCYLHSPEVCLFADSPNLKIQHSRVRLFSTRFINKSQANSELLLFVIRSRDCNEGINVTNSRDKVRYEGLQLVVKFYLVNYK